MSRKRPTTQTYNPAEPLEDDKELTLEHPRSTSHAHPTPIDPPATTHDPPRTRSPHDAHEADPLSNPGPFPHEKLDVYRVALEMAALAKQLADEIPRGYRSVADHLLRAASNSVLLYAEGANRRGSALKRQRFVESRGETGEVAAAGDLILVLHLANAARATRMKQLAGRVSAMLTRLIARLV